MARPPFQPTAEQRSLVARAARAGLEHAQIAELIGLHRNTLRKYFWHEMNEAAAMARLEIVEGLYAAAMAGKVTAALRYMRGPRPRVRRDD